MKQNTNESHRILEKSRTGFSRILFGRSILILALLLLHFLLLFSVLMPLMERLPALFGGVVAFTAIMQIHVLNTPDNPSVKLSWCVLIAVLPLFGTMLYFIFRFDLGYRIIHRRLRASMEESVPHIPDPAPLLAQMEDRDLKNLSTYLYRSCGCPVFGNTEVRYFPSGEAKFEEMLVQLEKAEHFIYLEYFIIGPSEMWSRILDILARKAQAGVDVRVMYDGGCAVTYLPYGYPEELKKLGIQCKMFSPFRPFLSTHYNNRDHRKILVIDGHTAFTGGINLQDRYINKKTVYGHWKDTAVMVHGDAARSFTLMFLQMWNASEKVRNFDPHPIPESTVRAEGCVIPYADSPMDRERAGKMVYLHLINQAKDRLWIMTPYLILDSEMLTAMTFAAKRGVDVRIILPHIPDKKSAFLLARSHYSELLEAGVRIYEYTPGFVHAKVCLCDDTQAVVGTINFDYRSLYLNFECAAYLYRVPAIRDIQTDFMDTMEKSLPISPEDVKHFPLSTRVMGRLLKLVAPLL